VFIDHSYIDTGGKTEFIWIIRPSERDIVLPHCIDSVGNSSWEKRIAYERKHGHSYLGFEYIEEGSLYLETEQGSSILEAGDSFFLFDTQAHRYVALNTVRKRFLSLSGPSAADLLRHFSFSPYQENYLLKKNLGLNKYISAWFDAVEESLKVDTASPSTLALAWYNLLCRMALSRAREAKQGRHPALERALFFIDSSLSRKITRAEIAQAALLSESHLSRLFRTEIGLSPSAYIVNRRLEWACQVLNSTRLSITEIALMVGFEDPLHFSTTFKKRFGVSPRRYRD